MFASFLKHPTQPIGSAGGIAGLAAFFRRVIPALGRRATANGALEHLCSLPLTAHASLTLVRLNEQQLLLGITPQGITLLAKGARKSSRKTRNTKNSARDERRDVAEPVAP